MVDLEYGDFVDVLVRELIPHMAWVVRPKERLPNEPPANGITWNEIIGDNCGGIAESQRPCFHFSYRSPGAI